MTDSDVSHRSTTPPLHASKTHEGGLSTLTLTPPRADTHSSCTTTPRSSATFETAESAPTHLHVRPIAHGGGHQTRHVPNYGLFYRVRDEPVRTVEDGASKATDATTTIEKTGAKDASPDAAPSTKPATISDSTLAATLASVVATTSWTTQEATPEASSATTPVSTPVATPETTSESTPFATSDTIRCDSGDRAAPSDDSTRARRSRVAVIRFDPSQDGRSDSKRRKVSRTPPTTDHTSTSRVPSLFSHMLLFPKYQSKEENGTTFFTCESDYVERHYPL